MNLRALRVSVVKKDVLALQGHCLNRSPRISQDSARILQRFFVGTERSGVKSSRRLDKPAGSSYGNTTIR
ncbi:MAG: hypothetical protein DMG08_28580 [Acidobacteria bacterium]|nr:MAG: hypothetical protein DMG08_28580 [Acidobacteriota bacterium]